jgi:hypothetical protein
MDKTERQRLDVIAMATIVIALGTFTSMVVDLRTTFAPVLPAGFVHFVLAILALTALFYAIKAIVKYHQS